MKKKRNKSFWGTPRGRRVLAGAMLVTIALLLPVSLFAGTGTGSGSGSGSADDFGLDAKVKIVLDLFTSPWVKGIACIALIAECIGLLTAGRQEPGMFKKFIPWIAGTLLFLAAGTITEKFMGTLSTATSFSDTLKLK